MGDISIKEWPPQSSSPPTNKQKNIFFKESKEFFISTLNSCHTQNFKKAYFNIVRQVFLLFYVFVCVAKVGGLGEGIRAVLRDDCCQKDIGEG
jgi:hypothetical protein